VNIFVALALTNAGHFHRNPFLETVIVGHFEVVEALLTHPDIDVNTKDSVGEFVLGYACGKGPREMALMHLSHAKIDVNLTNMPSRAAQMKGA